MTTAALIAAMTAALGPLAIPIEPVPVTFQTFCVALAALLLPPGWAAGSMALYVALGAAGLPVFSKGAAGVGVLLGPTGGYLIGFVIGAGVGSLTRLGLRRAGSSRVVADIGAGIMLLVVVYGIGTAWLAYAAHLPLAAAAAAGVAPFVIGDAVKIAVAIAIAESVRSAVLGAD
ncbi:MAG: biotin transporter BioY [Coriobacteriia bacterium]|nr:biotin transporter BioY [Coriobacteriia bacterium]